MEHVAIFEQKIALTPSDLNKLSTTPLDALLVTHLRAKLEGSCSSHGFVIPQSLELLSRSMGHVENGRYTGNVIFHLQAQGRVYNPSNGTLLIGEVLKKNKMGLYIIYKDAIRILVPRDLHLGNDAFEAIQPGDQIQIEIRKSRFQVNDPFILSVGVFIEKTINGVPVAAASASVAATNQNKENSSPNEGDEGDEDQNDLAKDTSNTVQPISVA